MKPPDAYIKYLQAHPAVWEALQKKWELAPADWFLHLETGHVGLLAVEESDEIVYIDKEAWYWLPNLGQLVRMLKKLILESPFNAATLDYLRDNNYWNASIWPHKIEWRTEPEDEPEIACTALWAKVKGVECG